jgi:hypothetical protein
LPAQGPRPPLPFCVAACVLALIRAAGAQDAPAPLEASRAGWPSTQQELPLPESGPTQPSLPGAEDASNETPSSTGEPPAGADEALTGANEARTDAGAADVTADTAAADAREPVLEDAPAGVGNDDIRAMTEAQFSESTILAVIAANATRFDVAPRALVALKGAGVSEKVIEAMLAAETAKKQAAAAASPVRDSAPQSSEEFAKLSAMIERLAAQQEAAESARRPPDPPKSTDSSPRAWIVNAADKTALAPTIAQVAFTDDKGGNRLKTLQGLAGKALAFANPAVSGIASTLGGLFRSDNEERTAVWALAGTAAAREMAADTVLEIEYGHTPGVDPDAYQPALVQLVRTTDNYRLVAAAKTEGNKTVATGKDPIVEELVATELTRLGRGHYRVRAKSALGPGEYALVLRPIVQKEKRRRNPEASLGELLGGGTSQILYLTWDFNVAAR